MAPTRKPKVGLDRPKVKRAGKPKEKPKEKQKLIYGPTINDYPKAKQKITYGTSFDDDPNYKQNQNTTEEWKQVSPKHLTRSDTHRKDIERIMPKLDEIIRKQTKSPTKKLPQWLITKFRDLKQHVENTDRSDLKVKETHNQVKSIAKALGHMDLFDTKNKELNPRKAPKETFEMELDKNLEEPDYDLDSLNQEEPDISDMPALLYGSSDDELTDLESKDKDETNEDNLSTDEEESEITDGAHFKIQLDKTNQENSEDNQQDILTEGILTQDEYDYDEADGPVDKHSHDNEMLTDTTKKIEDQFKNAERLLDKEVQEIEEIHLHTPKVQRSEIYNTEDMETMAAQAIHNQWQEKRDEMETEWNENRVEAETEYKELIEEQTNIQMSLVTQDVDNIRQNIKEMNKGIETAKRTLDEIQNQNVQLKRNTDNRNRQIGLLQAAIIETRNLKEELKQETATLNDMKTATREENVKLKQTMQEMEKAHLQVENRVKATVHKTIQEIVDTKMIPVEKAIRKTLLEKGRIITHQAKAIMREHQEDLTQDMEHKITKKSDETFQEAASLLDQAVMRIGEEMDGAIIEFRSILFDPQERQVYSDRLHQQAMNEIRPKIAELQDDLIKEVAKDIEKAVQEAQDDLHMNQGKLTADMEEKFRLNNEIIQLNIAAMKSDLRNEAELLETEIRNRPNNDRSSRQHEEPATQPSTPRHAPRGHMNNPYSRTPQVSPHQDVNIPSEDTWNQMVCKCKEKATLTYALPQDTKDLDQSQAEAFYRQTESNFKGYPAVRLNKFDDLTRRGNTIPVAYAMGWPPEYVSEGSTILYEKLAETIPFSMHNIRNILDQFQRTRDGYQALMTIMKRSIPRLGQLPPKMEPLWPKGATPTEYANKLQTYVKQQERLGRNYCDFEIAATIAQRAMEHHEYYNVGSNRATQLVQMATNYEDFKDIEMTREDSPHLFAALLETYHQGTQQHHISMMSGNMDPTINKFDRNDRSNAGGNGGRNRNRSPREIDRDGKPREICPCCLRHGHNVEKGSVCWMGAQVENVIKYNKENPEQAKKNMENFKTALNPATVAKMQLRFPDEFKDIEPDSLEMLEAAVELFEIFQTTA
jgi:hypothetical protein